MKIMNPSNESCIDEVTTDTSESLTKKYRNLLEGQKAWSQKSFAQRKEILNQFVQLLKEEEGPLAKDLTEEVGKPLSEAQGEIRGARARCSVMLEQGEALWKEKTVETQEGLREVLAFEPLGVIGNISAWNFPFLVGVNVFFPALLAGNAVMYKPSECSTLTGLNIHRLLLEAGVPENVFSLAIGAGDVGAQLCQLPLDGFFFTGSYPTGMKIKKSLGDRLIPVGMELGGKDPIYVRPDVKSVSEAAVTLVEGAFYNAGQSCCSVERIYVHDTIYEEFVKHFVTEARNWKLGDPLDPSTRVGPLTRAGHDQHLLQQIGDAVQKGAEVLVGGHKLDGKGHFFEPTVLTHVNHEMDLMKEETFGPVIGLQKVMNDEEALELMQDTTYGLTAGIFTQDEEKGVQMLRQVNAGNVYLNCCDRVSPYLPWNGRNHSGLGSTLGTVGLLSFVKPKGYHIRMG